MNLQRTQIYLDKDMIDRLKKLAEEETEATQSKVTLSSIVRRFITRGIGSQAN